jgi:acetyl esterase/lipase
LRADAITRIRRVIQVPVPPDDIRTRRIVYTVPGMERVKVQRGLAFRTVDGEDLHMDLYAPDEVPVRRPAVVFVHGGPIPRGSAPKDWGVFESYGELVAASGLIGITFNHRYHAPADMPTAEADVRAAIEHVRANAGRLYVDENRLAIWAYSGGGPLISFVLRESLPYVRCLVTYYAVLDLQQPPGPLPPGVTDDMLRRYSPVACLRDNKDRIPPVFVARAGRDNAWLNGTVDRFVTEALGANITIDVMNHPVGQHGFDILNGDARSRAIIARTIEFVRTSLAAALGSDRLAAFPGNTYES